MFVLGSHFVSAGNSQPAPMLGRQRADDPPLVTLTTRPTVRDIARLHNETALLIQELFEWFATNGEALTEIQSGFEDVEKVSAGACTASVWKASDATVMLEELDRAEEMLNYVKPSVVRLAETTECLLNDFARLASGVVTVPPVEHVGLLDEFWEKKEMLERQVAHISKSLETLEEMTIVDESPLG
eukprot:Protomagalhaensia_sp_Gyna_25__876@NODE_1422_length_1850_cov_541_589729_g1147_i0_p1_GENE_NODE_1422_length_1850_cov_541_589729_g1147_i0NODE_1422_length_1850_cov_541_589729_g1147_i0_p1_ORF_typecomplete_len186_score34_10YojJ/PF10372_9/1_2e03YojJ/PF10372_9/6_4YojJ/PF10372_9/1_9e02_NODE_1422_length_1850_cov_541_589729_g1147_i012421799